MAFTPITPIPSLPTKPDADADLWNTRYLEIDALFDDLEDGTSTTYWNGVSFETPAGTSDGHVINEEGTPLTQRVNLDFIGASVLAADAGGSTTNVTINGAKLAMNIEALAGNHTLTDASEPIQALTPDAARDVNLPAEAVTNPTFLIANPSGSGFVLTIKDDSPAIITTVADGETKLIVPDGVTWYATSDTIQLDELTTTAATDLLEIMDDVGGTPTKKKISITSLFDDIPVDVTIAKDTAVFTVNATGNTDARFTLEDAGTPKAHFWFDQSEGNLVVENDSSGGLTVFNTNNGGWSFFDDNTSLAQILFGATGSAIFNEQGNDVDFNVEAVGVINALFVQGSDGSIGVGTGSPSFTDAGAAGIHISTSTSPVLRLQDSNSANSDYEIRSPSGSNSLEFFHVNTTNVLLELSSGGLAKFVNAIHIAEITTPTPVADSGAIYTKADNKLYFQDGAGAEHEVALVP